MKRWFLASLLAVATLQVQAQRTLTLADCRQLAIQHNKEVAIAAKQVKAAESLKKAARTQYLPNISANGGYLHNQRNFSLLGEDQYLPVISYNAAGTVNYAGSWNNGWTVVNGTPIPLDANSQPFNPKTNPEKILWKSKAYIPKEAFEIDSRNIYVGAVSLVQPLFTGGKIRELNRLADSGKKLAEALQESTIAETLLDTDLAYWRIVSLVHKRNLAESYVNLLRKLEQNLDKSVAFGVATKSDALSVKVKLNEAETSLLQAEDGLNLSRMVLCQLCGLPLEDSVRVADETATELGGIPENVPVAGASVYDRPEIKSLQQMSDMAESNRRLAVSRFLPNAVLNANYSVSNPNVYDGMSHNFGDNYQIGVAVNVPLFHFGDRLHTLQAAREERDMAGLKLEEAREKVELDMKQAQYRTIEAQKKTLLTRSGKDKAEENLRYATVGFEAGTITASTLMEAQTAWLKACSEDIDARIDVRISEVRLQKAMGNLQ